MNLITINYSKSNNLINMLFFLPQDIENIIIEHKYHLEHREKYSKCMKDIENFLEIRFTKLIKKYPLVSLDNIYDIQDDLFSDENCLYFYEEQYEELEYDVLPYVNFLVFNALMCRIEPGYLEYMKEKVKRFFPNFTYDENSYKIHGVFNFAKEHLITIGI